jgi:hypothetical protein
MGLTKIQFVEKDLIAINIFAHARTFDYSGFRFTVYATYRPKNKGVKCLFGDNTVF